VVIYDLKNCLNHFVNYKYSIKIIAVVMLLIKHLYWKKITVCIVCNSYNIIFFFNYYIIAFDCVMIIVCFWANVDSLIEKINKLLIII